jgi:acetyl esterase/lipase
MFRKIRMAASYLVLAVAVLASLFFASAQDDASVRPGYVDLPYVENGDYKQKVDVYLPANELDEPLPTILLLHGNGYTKWDMEPLADHFVKQGYAAVAVEFRNKFDEFPSDVFCALAWAHTYAEDYHFDSDRFVILGHSLGGFGAALVGVTDDASEFLTECPHDLPEDNWLRGVVLYAAGGIDSADEDMEEDFRAWVVEHLDAQMDANDPAFLLIHGTNDIRVNQRSSQSFARRLKESGVKVELIILDEVGHFFINPESEVGTLALTAVDPFLEALFEDEEAGPTTE